MPASVPPHAPCTSHFLPHDAPTGRAPSPRGCESYRRETPPVRKGAKRMSSHTHFDIASEKHTHTAHTHNVTWSGCFRNSARGSVSRRGEGGGSKDPHISIARPKRWEEGPETNAPQSKHTCLCVAGKTTLGLATADPGLPMRPELRRPMQGRDSGRGAPCPPPPLKTPPSDAPDFPRASRKP